MKCPNCNCTNVKYDITEKKNTGKRILHMVGAGALAVGGIVALPIPGLHNMGLACLASSVAVGKTTPSKTTTLTKYVCRECGCKWEL